VKQNRCCLFSVSALTVLCTIALFTSNATAEQITLNNGEIIVGKILSETDRSIVVEMDYGSMEIRKSKIQSIGEEPYETQDWSVYDEGQTDSSAALQVTEDDTQLEEAANTDESDPEEDNTDSDADAQEIDEQQVRDDIAIILASASAEADLAAARLLDVGSACLGDMKKAIEGAEDPEEAARLVTLLGNIKDPSVKDYLDEIANKKDAPEQIRLAVAGALAKYGDQRASDELSSLIDSEDAETRQLAASCLRRIENPTDEVIDALVRHLNDKDDWVRITSTRGLLGIAENNPSEKTLNKLVEMLHKSEPDSAVQVALILHQAKRSEGLDFLVEMSQSVTAQDRLAAVQALKNCHTPKANEALRSCLTDERASVRKAVIEALRWSKDPNTINELKPLLDDPDTSVARMARTTITQLLKSQ